MEPSTAQAAERSTRKLKIQGSNSIHHFYKSPLLKKKKKFQSCAQYFLNTSILESFEEIFRIDKPRWIFLNLERSIIRHLEMSITRVIHMKTTRRCTCIKDIELSTHELFSLSREREGGTRQNEALHL